YLFHRDHSVQEQITEGIACAMPAQPIAARTSRKAVLRGLCAALITLDDMIHFPVSIGLFIPAPVFKLDPVAAKVAMSGCFVVNLQQLTLTHSHPFLKLQSPPI